MSRILYIIIIHTHTHTHTHTHKHVRPLPVATTLQLDPIRRASVLLLCREVYCAQRVAEALVTAIGRCLCHAALARFKRPEASRPSGRARPNSFERER